MNLFASLAALFLLIASSHADEGKDLLILSGQSNMAGLKPEESFTPAVEKALGKENVIVVKDAHGGQPIRKWYKKWKPANGDAPEKTGELYDRLMGKVNAAIEGKKIETVTFLWMQGEKDAKSGLEAAYQPALKQLIANLRRDLEAPEMNVVIGRLSDHSPAPQWRAGSDS